MSDQSSPILGRRDFLRGATAASAAAFLPTASHAAPDLLTTISIIHTTDLHGHILPTSTYEGVPDVGGFARCASLIRRWRAENPDHLLIDVGDLYQGTHVSRSTDGQLMIDLENAFNYDAWVLGNHEFDWGIGVVEDIVGRSKAPVLTANVELHGKPAGQLGDDKHPFANVAPTKTFEIAGFKIGLVGIITPGLSYWLPPDLTKGVEALNPAPIVNTAAKQLRADGADAVVVAGHMGSKFGRDDFANRVDDVLKTSVGEIDAFIAGHTHRDLASMKIQRALYTQAGYYGIFLGRVDLTFHRETRKLVDRRAFTVLMDDRFPLDPLVLEMSKTSLAVSERELAKSVGTFAKPISADAKPGAPSETSRLIAAAIDAALKKAKSPAEAIVHGQFTEEDIPAGEKTLADLWKILPYENRVVTASLTFEQLRAALEEMYGTRYSKRNLIGVALKTSGEGENTRVVSIAKPDGKPLTGDARMRVAFNSYDARSGGQRFMKLREILAEPSSKTRYEDIETRSALVDYVADCETVTQADLL